LFVIAAYVNDPEAVLPYKYISDYGIKMEGLPKDVELKHPGNYGISTMREILARKVGLRITCMQLTV